ncbi:MAG: STAS domain-containing protein [Candidatus Thiodiazotropha sp.]
MMTALQKSDGNSRVVVEGEMTIYTAAAQKEELIAQLDRCTELELDLGEVSELDSAGVQILLMLKNETTSSGKSLRLVNHSEAVIEVFELLDLSPVFGEQLTSPTT